MPARDSAEWEQERWQRIPDDAPKHGIRYQCEKCMGGPIRRLHMVTEPDVLHRVRGKPRSSPMQRMVPAAANSSR